ncbi:MAG: MarR family transcriptional regulator [Phycisphaerales bacterium]|nr:MarR family transcriptional regulator [Phycisphaerales bacterium]
MAKTARFFKDHEITAPQYNALRILRGHGERMRTHQVADELVTREPDITRLIDRLADRGFVVRDRCESDRRVVWVELTAKGAAVLKKLDKPLEELHLAQLRHLGPRKLKQLNQLLFEARHPEY